MQSMEHQSLVPHHFTICYDKAERSPIPLELVEYSLKVLQGFTIVQIKQMFSTNKFTQPIDIEYAFAINENAAVSQMVIEIGDEKKYAIIKEKEEAQKDFDEGIEQGKTMALSKQDEQFPQIQKLSIGQLAPNKSLVITFEYIQPLSIFLNKYWKVELNQFIDQNYLEKEVNYQQLRYYQDLKQYVNKFINIDKFQLNFKQTIKVEINIGGAITAIKSPSHKIKILNQEYQQLAKQNDEKLMKATVELDDIPENYLPNKTFILLFSSDDINLPKAQLSRTLNDALQSQKYCATLTFIPKFNEVSLDDAYQQYLDGQNFNSTQTVNKSLFLFFIDQSGSMKGQKIIKARSALILFLKSLPQGCKFNLISFGSGFKCLWPKPKEFSQNTQDQAVNYVKNIDADMGGTEIMKTLKSVVYDNLTQIRNQNPNLIINIFLLTDGQDDEEPILNLVTKNNNPETRIYSLGIGDDCCQNLIKQVAEITKGKYHFMSDYEDIGSKVIDLLEDSLTSYLKQFQLQTNVENIAYIIPDPKSILTLKKNEELMIQILFSSDQKQELLEFQLSCFDPQQQKQIKYSVQLNLNQSQQIDYFHKYAIHKLIKQYESTKQIQEDIKTQDIVNLSLEHQILCSKTAFICEVCYLEDQFKQLKREKIFIKQKIEKEQHQLILYCKRRNVFQENSQLNKICLPQIKSKRIQLGKDFNDRSKKGKMGGSSINQNLKKQLQNSLLKLPKFELPIIGYSLDPIIVKQKEIFDFDDIIIAAQADGSFIFSPQYIREKLKIDEFKKFMTIKHDLQTICTIIALFLLEIYHADKKLSWYLIHSKAQIFLKKNQIDYKLYQNKHLKKYSILLGAQQ